MKNIGIIGSGSFGCALANVLIKNHNVKIWSFKKEESDVINNEHRCMFIDNSKLDERIVCYTNYEDVIEDSEYLILVTPSSVIRNTCQNIKKYVTNQKIIIASKGMEIETNKFLIDIVKEELDLKYIGVISGPSIAKEVINDMGLKVVFASNNSDYNNEIKNNFETDKFKIELSDDVIGTELGGTLKNIISIASGLVNGLNLGNNMNAILITKGLEEIKKIGLKLGAKEETFYGLSSLGDLLTTCLSNESRNNRCGILLSQGKKIDEIKEEIGMVIEGLDALKIAYNISQKYNINTKISNSKKRFCPQLQQFCFFRWKYIPFAVRIPEHPDGFGSRFYCVFMPRNPVPPPRAAHCRRPNRSASGGPRPHRPDWRFYS